MTINVLPWLSPSKGKFTLLSCSEAITILRKKSVWTNWTEYPSWCWLHSQTLAVQNVCWQNSLRRHQSLFTCSHINLDLWLWVANHWLVQHALKRSQEISKPGRESGSSTTLLFRYSCSPPGKSGTLARSLCSVCFNDAATVLVGLSWDVRKCESERETEIKCLG